MNGKDAGIRTMPGTTAPSLPADWKPYVYRGTGEDVLTPRLKSGPRPKRKPKPEPELAPEPFVDQEPGLVTVQDEARLRELEEHLAARGVIDAPGQVAPEPEPEVKPTARCGDCGYLTTAPGHLVICGSGS